MERLTGGKWDLFGDGLGESPLGFAEFPVDLVHPDLVRLGMRRRELHACSLADLGDVVDVLDETLGVPRQK